MIENRSIVSTTAFRALCSLLVAGMAYAQSTSFGQMAAPCAPPTARAFLSFNNVRALIENGGSMWQDRTVNQASYEVPAGGGVSSMYAGSLWLGGLDGDGQLHVAAQTYGSLGSDFFPGPLSEMAAQTTGSQCQEYDEIHLVTRQEVVRHLAYHEAVADGLEAVQFPNGYDTPASFQSWPAHGNLAQGQAPNLAPFVDFDSDGVYDPESGDCPGFDVLAQSSCPENFADFLHGDECHFWIFNDVGNVHSESGGAPLGVEIQAQAWGWAANLESVSNATFYTFNIINRSSNSYSDFNTGWWADPDVGSANDDYVGCDVSRGLGYAYNGDAIDEPSSSSSGYGTTPPAIGIDFVLGLKEDADGLDNVLSDDVDDALENGGLVYPGSGSGFGDGIADNERRGMKHFLYYTNSNNPINGQPTAPQHYHNYMNGVWKNGQPLVYGGDGVTSASGANLDIEASFMFPGESDPHHAGTQGVAVEPWSDATGANPPGDRRFVMSMGPVNLEPGGKNDFTMAALWARAEGGGPEASVEVLRAACDEVQALFDSCFDEVGCMDETALNFDNSATVDLPGDCLSYEVGCGTLESANWGTQNWSAQWIDDTWCGEFGSTADELLLVLPGSINVEGLGEIDVSEAQLLDAQGLPIGLSVDLPIVLAPGQISCIELDGVPEGVGVWPSEWTLSVTTEYGEQLLLDLPLTMVVEAAQGGGILPGMTSQKVVKREGAVTGFRQLRLSEASEMELIQSPNGKANQVTYQAGQSPIDVYVLDGTNEFAEFTLGFDDIDDPQSIPFTLINVTTGDTAMGHFTGDVNLVVYPEWGIAVAYDVLEYANNARVASKVQGVNDPSSEQWLFGHLDEEGYSVQNWIRSGLLEYQDVEIDNPFLESFNDLFDEEEIYEAVLDGTWAPYSAVSATLTDVFNPSEDSVYAFFPGVAPTRQGLTRLPQWNKPTALTSVHLVLTSDKTQWTRCPVLEMQPNPSLAQDELGGDGTIQKMNLRRHLSVDKQGLTLPEGGDPEECNLVSATGMGWFPGYAIDTQLGERMNVAFGEDSWNVMERGDDMIFNPPGEWIDPSGMDSFTASGQHWIYIFKDGQALSENSQRMPSYDQGAFIVEQLSLGTSTAERTVFRDCAWVGCPKTVAGFDWSGAFETARVKLDVSLEPTYYSPLVIDLAEVEEAENDWRPLFEFSTFIPNCDFAGNLTEWNSLDAGLYPEEDRIIFLDEQTYFSVALHQDSMAIDSTTGMAFPVQDFTPASVQGLPEGMMLLTTPAPMAPNTQQCLEFGGTPLEAGTFEVVVEGNLVLTLFGEPYMEMNQTRSFTLIVATDADVLLGCAYPFATNYNPAATVDDGSCYIAACTDVDACNYSPFATTDDGSCFYDCASTNNSCVSDLDGDGAVGSADLIEFLTAFGETCE